MRTSKSLAELCSDECLSKGPTSGCDIVRDDRLAVTGGNLKRQGLSVEVGIALPILSPVPTHWLPRHCL